MRTAILSAVKRTSSGELRAELFLAGRSVLAWQTDLVLALRCERIVCICDAPNALILGVQQEAEARGSEFHTVHSNLQIVGLVRADDEIVMLADGLLIDNTVVGHVRDPNDRIERALITIPSEHRLAQGHPDDFERMDRDRHWAGLAIMRADQVHKLADLPPDGDAMSMLLRLALQTRIACHDGSGSGLADDNWLLAADQSTLVAHEQKLLRDNVLPVPVSAPFHALSAMVVRQSGASGLSINPQAAAGFGVFVMLVGMGVTAWGAVPIGIAISASGAFAAMLARQWALLRERLWPLPGRKAFMKAASFGVEALALGSLVFGYISENPPLPAITLPLFAIGLSHLLARGKPLTPAIPFWDDRALHLAGFAIAAELGYLGEAVALFGLACLGHFLVNSHRATD